MIIPFYNEILDSNHKLCGYQILGSYLSKSGNLIECISNHKGNTFDYSIKDGLRYLKLIESTKIENINYDLKKDNLNYLKSLLYILNKPYTIENAFLFYKYYNFIDEKWLLDKNGEQFISKDIVRNLNNLILADIDICQSFIDLNKIIVNLVKIGYEKNMVFGVEHGMIQVKDISDLLLKKLLNNKNDFLIQFVGFDKIETSLNKTITTSKLNINETFFNYLIMDFNIQRLPKIVIDYQNKQLKKITSSKFDLISNSCKENEYAEEISLIKKYIPTKDRIKYMK